MIQLLIEFHVENFKSFREEITFSMVAGKDKSKNRENLAFIPNIREKCILKSAIIYGANASGKSNFLRALDNLTQMVLQSAKFERNRKIPFYNPFKLDSTCLKSPTKFDITFTKNSKKYIYKIAYNGDFVVEESLYHYRTNRFSTIFERIRQDAAENFPENSVFIGPYVYRFPAFRRLFKEIAKKTNDNTLFLSKTRTENVPITDDISQWFEDLVILHDFGTELYDLKYTSKYILDDFSKKNQILNALTAADLGIDNLTIDEKSYNLIYFDQIRKAREDDSLKSIISKEDLPEPKIFRNDTLFDLNTEESEGTKKFFALIGPLLQIIDNGGILIYDELDIKIHPLLCQYIIKLFNNERNESAQLIFTTHNTYFLNQDIFRRDQIWFTEKNPNSYSTTLYSLLEFKPRKDKNLEKGYLEGKYGAIPFLPEGCIEIWENQEPTDVE